MKATISNNNKTKKIPFPKLMRNINTGAIWLMFNESSGTILIEADSLYTQGEYSTTICILGFVDFEGSITLSND